MTDLDLVFLAVTSWKENRSGGTLGLTSIINVVVNRSVRDGSSCYAECVKRLQFSSITAPGDPELTLWPSESDPQFIEAQALAQYAATGGLADLTGGAVDYYAPGSIKTTQTIVIDGVQFPFPQTWNEAAVRYTVTIGKQLFFVEV